MYGGLVALADPTAVDAATVGSQVMAASFEGDGDRSLSVDKGWMWIGRTLEAAFPHVLVPFGARARVFTGDLDAAVAAALQAVGSPEEAFALAEEHGEPVMAVLQATEYGPLFWLTDVDVRAVVSAIASADADLLRAAATQAAADPNSDPVHGEDVVEEILALVARVQTFLATAATRGDAGRLRHRLSDPGPQGSRRPRSRSVHRLRRPSPQSRAARSDVG